MSKKIIDISNDKQSMDLDVSKLAVGGSYGAIVKKREYIEDIVDEPCLEACLDLYDKNIQTVGSTANKQNVGNIGEITINYNSLSEKNKYVVKFLVEKGILKLNLSDDPNKSGGREFSINVPIDEESTCSSVSEKFMEISNFFVPQDVLYGRYDKDKYYEDNEKNIIFLSENGAINIDENGNINENDLIPVICDYLNVIYDDKTKQFWASEELLKKHNDYIDKTRDEVDKDKSKNIGSL